MLVGWKEGISLRMICVIPGMPMLAIETFWLRQRRVWLHDSECLLEKLIFGRRGLPVWGDHSDCWMGEKKFVEYRSYIRHGGSGEMVVATAGQMYSRCK